MRAKVPGERATKHMSFEPSVIATGLDAARTKIANTIKSAASATGASFEYLVSAAKMESNLDPTAQASTSSARGLYQFIEQTWLGTVKEAGAAFGFGKYADAISKSPTGTYSVNDPAAARNEILKLRDDPAANAAMAGVLTQSNSFKLTDAIGRQAERRRTLHGAFHGRRRCIKTDHQRAGQSARVSAAAAVSQRRGCKPLDLL